MTEEIVSRHRGIGDDRATDAGAEADEHEIGQEAGVDGTAQDGLAESGGRPVVDDDCGRRPQTENLDRVDIEPAEIAGGDDSRAIEDAGHGQSERRSVRAVSPVLDRPAADIVEDDRLVTRPSDLDACQHGGNGKAENKLPLGTPVWRL